MIVEAAVAVAVIAVAVAVIAVAGVIRMVIVRVVQAVISSIATGFCPHASAAAAFWICCYRSQELLIAWELCWPRMPTFPVDTHIHR